MRQGPLAARGGILVESEGEALSDVARERVGAWLDDSGLLLLRGFARGVAELDALVARCSAERMAGAGRSPWPAHPLVQTANESLLALEPHTDHGTRAERFRPRVTWFWCDVPADAGGETTFFDGVAVWQRLSVTAQARLTEKRVVFATPYAAAAWQKLGFADAAGFARFAESMGGVVRGVDGAGTVQVEIASPAIARTGRGEVAFISSLCVAGAPGFELMRVTLEGGEPIDAGLRAEIGAAMDAVCLPVAWRAGDVVAVDNLRYLHGRRAYRDTRRRLYLAQTLRMAVGLGG